MKKVAIYVRVSTHDQAEEGYSVDEQIDKLKKYCEIMGWTLYDTYIDPGYTGSNIDRPGLKKLIQSAKQKEFDTVLAYKLDRLSRSQKDTLYLIEDVFIKHGVDFVSLNENFDTSTPFGKAMIGILSVFAQLEREQITERMQMGKVGRAKSGKAMSWAKPPFGYTYEDSKYIIEPLEASVVKQIYNDYMSGISITKLRTKLNDEGHIGRDIKWSYRSIRFILDNPVYTGYMSFKGEIYKGNHKVIISKELYDKVQAELIVRQKEAYEKFNPRPFQAKYMLSGTVKCGYCGAPLEVQTGRRTNGDKTYRYQCKNRSSFKQGSTIYNDGEKCRSGFYYMQDLEEYVLKEIEHAQLNPSSIFKYNNGKEEVDYTNEYKKRVSKLEKQLEKLSDLYLNDMMTLDVMQQKAMSLQREKRNLQSKIEQNDTKLKENKALQFLKTTDIRVEEASYEQQKTLVNNLIDKVDVTSERMKIHWSI